MKAERNWDILLIGGASGSGKTSISYPLSLFYGIPVVESRPWNNLMKRIIKKINIDNI